MIIAIILLSMGYVITTHYSAMSTYEDSNILFYLLGAVIGLAVSTFI